jgi:hypothetical protein
MSKLSSVDPNKTVVFVSPVQYDDVLVRTGTPRTNTSFFDAVLYAYSREYVDLNSHDRKKFVKKLRASLYGNIDKEEWQKIGSDLIVKIPLQEMINNIITGFYQFITEQPMRSSIKRNVRHVVKRLIGDDAKQLDVYTLVTDLIPLHEGFEQTILPNAYDRSDAKKPADISAAVIDEALKYARNTEELASVSSSKAKYIYDTVSNMLTEILSEAETATYNNYVKNLENLTEEIDPYMISLVSDRFNRDIYFLNGTDRLPYNDNTDNLKGRKSIILLHIPGSSSHYETVGRMLPNHRIQKEFSHDDPLIQRMYTFLVKPEQIHDKYPELETYLSPGDHQVEPTRFSDSEHTDNDSDTDQQSDDEEY